jgi:hypothetical protein
MDTASDTRSPTESSTELGLSASGETETPKPTSKSESKSQPRTVPGSSPLIIRRMDAAILVFELAHNRRPKKLLLGKVEWEQVAAHCAALDFPLDPDPKDERSRPEYEGSKLYRVDDRNYLFAAP